MTALQSKPTEPDRPPERRGHREPRPRTRRHPRSRSSTAAASATPTTSARSSTPSASSSSASRAVLLFSLFPPAWVVGHGRAVGREDPREHGDRPQRHARPVGLDARPQDPLHHLGVGQRLPRRHVEALAQRDRTTPTPTSSARTTTSATASCASTRTSGGCPFYLGPAAVEPHQRLLLRVRHRRLRPRDRQVPQGQDGQGAEFRRQSKDVLAKIRRQVTKDYVLHPLLSGPSALTTLDREPHRQPGPQPVDALGDHVRALPRGRRRPSRRHRSRARPAASGTCGRCSARPTSAAAGCCTS